MKKISLVTGGAGFIGSHVVNHLIREGHQVVVVDDLSGGFKENIHPKAVFHPGSITDETLINKLFDTYHFTYVYHLAAYAAEGLSHFIRRYNYTNNLTGSVTLINAAVNHNVKCFVFTSSIAVYGDNASELSENTPPQPADPYGIAKYAVELDLQNAHKMFGLDYVIFRPHNVYGPHQHLGDRYRNVVGIFMNQLLSNKPLTVFGDGSQTRAFSYIDDVAPYIAKAPDLKAARNQTFNIGCDQSYSVNELAKAVCKAMNGHQPIQYLAARQEAHHARATHRLFRQAFGPAPLTPLDEGLAQMATWAKKRGAQTPSRFGSIEIEKNLPCSWR